MFTTEFNLDAKADVAPSPPKPSAPGDRGGAAGDSGLPAEARNRTRRRRSRLLNTEAWGPDQALSPAAYSRSRQFTGQRMTSDVYV